MNLIDAEVIENRRVLPGHKHVHARGIMSSWLIWLQCPEIAREAMPGQFVMVRCGPETTLPRPFSVHQADGDRIALLYAVREDGRGTEWLSRQKSGVSVPIFGPLGNGFALPSTPQNLLLVAGGIGIAPLYFLAQRAVRNNYKVTLLYGTVDQNRYPVAPEIDAVAVTEDGSVGEKGFVTDLLPRFVEQADQVFACGPMPMYHDMFRRRQELKLEGRPAQVSLEVRMGCGVGVCYGCTIKTNHGLKQVCKDGPVFNLDEILWDELN
ncbi:MAG: dihydroorotate dehydrogenase electron transfer subunit [Dehalococcoidales bacterium]